MKKNNQYVNRCLANREDKLTRENPIHYYGEKQTITGFVYNGYRSFSRPGGSSQYVFTLYADARMTRMELYMSAERNPSEADRVLNSGRMLKINFCRRYDVYIDRNGNVAERSFLFIDSPEDIQPLEDRVATA